MPIPNFFIIGATKCGTTALSEYLKGNPKIFVSSPKEPHYFNFDLKKLIQINLEEYLGLFSSAEQEIHSAIGEASTHYLFSKCAVSEILKFNPKSKFIIILRNPVDLVYSWHSECVFQGTENILDFKTAWLAGDERKKGKMIPFLCHEPKDIIYSDWGKIGEQVKRVFSLVQRSNLKVILFEDFVSNPKKIYDEVLVFLNVPSDERKEFPKINENKLVLFPRVQRFVLFIAEFVQRVKRKLGIRSGLGVLEKIISLNRKLVKRVPLDDNLRKEIFSFYKDDIRELSSVLNRDLSHWR